MIKLHLKIGTRGSKLALWQAYHVQDLLKKAGVSSEIVIIDTKGDQILDRSLSKIGSKGVFTQELEDQLRDGSIDMAVHSAKDLQSELANDLEIIAFTERERVNDVLVSHQSNLSLKNAEPFVVGTSSTRRIALLKHYYPHIKTVDMRGNLQTRLRKLEEGQCNALLLAYAGVHRMGYDDKIAEHLSLEEFIPAVGQGSVAIEITKNLASDIRRTLKKALNHADTEACLIAERAFLKTLQGGCSVPVFGLATLENAHITLKGGVVSLDGTQMLQKSLTKPIENAEQLGQELAQELIKMGADVILKEIKAQMGNA